MRRLSVAAGIEQRRAVRNTQTGSASRESERVSSNALSGGWQTPSNSLAQRTWCLWFCSHLMVCARPDCELDPLPCFRWIDVHCMCICFCEVVWHKSLLKPVLVPLPFIYKTQCWLLPAREFLQIWAAWLASWNQLRFEACGSFYV